VTRSGSFAVLGSSAAIVAGCALIVVIGITTGLWQPRGAPPQTARPVPGFGGVQLGARSYGEFLSDVREGRVLQVTQQGQLVQVDSVDGPYTVDAPSGADVLADITAASESGGVPAPPFAGEEVGPRTITYDEFLAEVKAGRISDVTHEHGELQASGVRGAYIVSVPSPTTDVLGDIENAAREGDVPPPYYSKAPGG
jgi:hypothetical protein